MPRRSIAFLASLLLGLAAASCSARIGNSESNPAPESSATRPPGRTVLPGAETPVTPSRIATGTMPFDAAAAMEHTRVLAVDIGERVSGTPGEVAAAQYIESQFASFGYVASIEPFTFEGNRFAAATVSIDGDEFTARPMQGSAGGPIEGPLVFVGRAMPADLEGKTLTGRIALADRGEILFQTKLENVLRAGAIGLIVVNDEDALMGAAVLDQKANVPVVSVALADRDALIAAASAGKAAVVASADSETASMNVLAKAPGTEQCVVLVGAHHDTVAGAPGGNDNASGVGHVLELARVFAADGLDSGLCFATFGGEESGLYGSSALAADLARSGELPEVMVNFDVTGLGLPVEAIGDPDLVGSAIAVAEDAGVEVIASSLPSNSSSDHASFEAVGVPVLFFTSGEFSTIHSPKDTFGVLSLDSFEAVGIAGYASITELYAELASP